jgi:hypothetical protein
MQAPLRQFAREAMDVTRLTAEQGVLQWQFGQCLLNHLRRHAGDSSTSLSLVPVVEREWLLSIAADLVQIATAIDGVARPTAYEMERFQQRKAVGLGKARLRCEAERLGHVLSDFGLSSVEGYEVAVCQQCEAGATVHLESGTVQSSAELKASCKRRWPR